MSKKFIDRDYLLHNLQNYHSFALFKDKQVEIVDIEESYNRVTDGTVDGAIEVTNDNIAIIQLFIADIAIGEYVEHIEKQTHFETVKETIYMPREDGYSKAEVDKLLDEVVAGDMAGLYVKIDDEDYLLMQEHTYDITTLTEEEISELFDLTDEEVVKLTKLIDDEVVSQQKLYSSYKVAQEVKQCLEDSKLYTESLIGNISGGVELLYVDTLPTEGKDNHTVYILHSTDGNPNTLNFYQEGSWIEVGDLDVDLDNFYTKEEIDALITNQAMKSEVILQDNLVQDLTSPSPSQVISTDGLKTELDLKANLDEIILKNNIVTLITDGSTDKEIPTAKSVYNLIKGSLDGSVNPETDLMTWAGQQKQTASAFFNSSTTSLPQTVDGCALLIYAGGGVKILLYITNDNIHFAWFNTVSWSTWRRVGNTTKANTTVNLSTLTATDCQVMGDSYYTIKDGVCYISAKVYLGSATGMISNLPTPRFEQSFLTLVYSDGANTINEVGAGVLDTTGTLVLAPNKQNAYYKFSCAYPIAE